MENWVSGHWAALSGPAAVVAAIAAVIAMIAAAASTRTAPPIDADKTDRPIDAGKSHGVEGLAERKFEFDKELAERKFQYERGLQDHKRRVDLAERVLSAFYAARAAFVAVRCRGRLESEGSSRTPEQNESPAQRDRRNIYFIPIERLTRDKERFAKLQSLQYLFAAHYGAEAAAPFEAYFCLYNEIVSAANSLIHMTHDEIDDAKTYASNAAPMLAVIGWGPSPRPDEIDRNIDAAVEEIEKMCRPVLQGDVGK